MTSPVAAPTANVRVSTHVYVWFGLALSLFSLIGLRQIFHRASAAPGTSLVLLREASMFSCAAILVWIVRRCERLPLRSVGLGTAPPWKSVLWGLLMAVAATIPALLIAKLTGYGRGPQASARLPVWVVVLVVVRAGLVEEFFYRGYAMTRLRRAGAGPAISFAGPLFLFAAAHWSGGWSSVLMAATVGAVFAGFFAWRKDLLANIFGHFALDFVTNVLPILLA